MTRRDQVLECMEAMEQGMERTATQRDIWQSDLIYWICKALYLLLKKEVKR